MSQENVEVIEEFYRRYAEAPDDFSLFAEDVEWHAIEGGLSGGAVIRGVEALKRHWAAVG